MLIREMKSDMCLCSTPVHTGTFLIGILTLVLELISILFEISSHTDDSHSAINVTELVSDRVKSFEYASYYADQIVVGSSLIRHVFYYVIHFVGLVAAILLIYGNRRCKPQFYLPYLIVSTVEIVVAGVESILFVVAIIRIRMGAYIDIPSEPESIRSDVVLILFAAIVLEMFVIALSIYFIWVVWRGKKYSEEYEKNPYDNNAFRVIYTNDPSGFDAGAAAPQPSVPAVYRI